MPEQRSKGASLAAIVELAKVRITIAVTLSTLTGYILYSGVIDAKALWASLGVFLLASSSSALNQYQERKTDALMTRTRKRPLPSGRLSISQAFSVIILLFVAGSIILYLQTNLLSLGLGMLTFVWYNAFYTPLKYRTVYALLIGSVIGALPPVIGWTAAGGEITATPALYLAFFIYLWQVPHFILLLLMYGDDYRKAGLPVLTTYFSHVGVQRIMFVWINGTMITGFMLPFICRLDYLVSILLMFVLSAGLPLSMLLFVLTKTYFNPKRAFILMNVYLLLVMVIISIDRLL
ncbi:MAG: protoheme IX farnesyltransferase [Bacteroidales bacterium]|nr:protoheme IX farnesyltransferase [Bacteroidales bacterium]